MKTSQNLELKGVGKQDNIFSIFVFDANNIRSRALSIGSTSIKKRRKRPHGEADEAKERLFGNVLNLFSLIRVIMKSFFPLHIVTYIECFSIIHEYQCKKTMGNNVAGTREASKCKFRHFCVLHPWLQMNAYHYIAIALHQIHLLKEHVKIDENRGQSRALNFRITRFTSDHEAT